MKKITLNLGCYTSESNFKEWVETEYTLRLYANGSFNKDDLEDIVGFLKNASFANIDSITCEDEVDDWVSGQPYSWCVLWTDSIERKVKSIVSDFVAWRC